MGGFAAAAVLLAGCDNTPSATTATPSTPPATTATTEVTISTIAATTTTVPVPTEPVGFSVPVGDRGVSYDLDGDPVSGPTSFTVTDAGSVVIADTIAMRRGEPRLLRFSSTGDRLDPFDLAEYEVAAVVDVVASGRYIAVLDVLISMERYRVLLLDENGALTRSVDVPAGFRFEDGLTGLAADDDGILLEFEFGSRYARLTESGEFSTGAQRIHNGLQVTSTPRSGRASVVTVGTDSFEVIRATDLGGVSVLGVAPDGTVLVVIDEVELSEGAIAVTRRVQRRASDGGVLAELELDVADQYVQIDRPLEMTAGGAVVYLASAPDHVQVAVLDL